MIWQQRTIFAMRQVINHLLSVWLRCLVRERVFHLKTLNVWFFYRILCALLLWTIVCILTSLEVLLKCRRITLILSWFCFLDLWIKYALAHTCIIFSTSLAVRNFIGLASILNIVLNAVNLRDLLIILLLPCLLISTWFSPCTGVILLNKLWLFCVESFLWFLFVSCVWLTLSEFASLVWGIERILLNPLCKILNFGLKYFGISLLRIGINNT